MAYPATSMQPTPFHARPLQYYESVAGEAAARLQEPQGKQGASEDALFMPLIGDQKLSKMVLTGVNESGDDN